MATKNKGKVTQAKDVCTGGKAMPMAGDKKMPMKKSMTKSFPMLPMD